MNLLRSNSYLLILGAKAGFNLPQLSREKIPRVLQGRFSVEQNAEVGNEKRYIN
jgi:hypothetical protein